MGSTPHPPPITALPPTIMFTGGSVLAGPKASPSTGALTRLFIVTYEVGAQGQSMYSLCNPQFLEPPQITPFQYVNFFWGGGGGILHTQTITWLPKDCWAELSNHVDLPARAYVVFGKMSTLLACSCIGFKHRVGMLYMKPPLLPRDPIIMNRIHLQKTF